MHASLTDCATPISSARTSSLISSASAARAICDAAAAVRSDVQKCLRLRFMLYLPMDAIWPFRRKPGQ